MDEGRAGDQTATEESLVVAVIVSDPRFVPAPAEEHRATVELPGEVDEPARELPVFVFAPDLVQLSDESAQPRPQRAGLHVFHRR